MGSLVHMANSSGHEDKHHNAPKLQISLSDFDIIRRLGDGSFSTVVLAKYKADGRMYAVKIVNKSLILRNKMADYIRNERSILDQLQHPGVAQLQFTFQDAESLYLGLEYCPNGELYEQLQERGALPMADVVQYAAEIVDILAYLRSKEVMHRDLKPENLLLDDQGHLKLIDFGSAKALFLPVGPRAVGNRATSFVGTAEYVSPEVLNNTGVSYAADLWALGCIIYQMLTGLPPFKGASEYLTFQLITSRSVVFAEDFCPVAGDLVDRLLQLEPSQRIGYHGIDEVMQHPFFATINWQAVRHAPAPQMVACKQQNVHEAALDWELTSLIRSSAPVRYEYLPTGATV